MATKKQLREALDKANKAYSILESKYKDVLAAYTENLNKLSEAEKELYKLQTILALPVQMEADKIINEHERT